MKKLAILCAFLISCMQISGVQAYAPSPDVDPAVWNQVKPYFLPEEHPVKPYLDLIFSPSRVILNAKALKKAGFTNTKPTKYNNMIVAKHPKLKGYLVKLYTDQQPNGDGWSEWHSRVVGAASVQATINKHGYQEMFKVPKKWIYPLPDGPTPPPGTFRQHFILVVEDMKIHKKKDNLFHWRSFAMTEERLDAIHTIFQEEGLIDSIYPHNLPFAKDGKQAFVDTQHHHRWPIDFANLTHFLSPKMQVHWTQKIAQ